MHQHFVTGRQRRTLGLALATTLGAIATLYAGVASAQEDYPTRPVTMVVPFPAGGTTDIVGRIVANALGEELGQNVVVQNIAGAGGNIGTASVAHSQPDGYMLVMGTVGTHAINPSLYSNMPYDHLADFEPISRAATVPNVLVANSQQPFETVAELVEFAKANPDEILYASSGNGTSIHLAAELFKVQAGVEMTHVPYPGSGPAVLGLMGNEVAIMFDNLPSSIAQIRSGDLRPIAVTSPERSPALPDVPTVEEEGFPGFNATSWFGLFAPTGTPEPVIDELNAALTTALAKPEVQEQLAEQGAEAHPETREEFATFIDAETAKWKEVVEVSGATVD